MTFADLSKNLKKMEKLDLSGLDKLKDIGKITTNGAGKKVGYIIENRVPLDKETVLNASDYIKTSKKIKGASVYKRGNNYYYRDTMHKGKAAHLEVFDKNGKHIGEADPQTGKIRANSADPKKRLKI